MKKVFIKMKQKVFFSLLAVLIFMNKIVFASENVNNSYRGLISAGVAPSPSASIIEQVIMFVMDKAIFIVVFISVFIPVVIYAVLNNKKKKQQANLEKKNVG